MLTMFLYRYVSCHTNHEVDTAIKTKSSYMESRRVVRSIRVYVIEHRNVVGNDQTVTAYARLRLSDRRVHY